MCVLNVKEIQNENTTSSYSLECENEIDARKKAMIIIEPEMKHDHGLRAGQSIEFNGSTMIFTTPSHELHFSLN